MTTVLLAVAVLLLAGILSMRWLQRTEDREIEAGTFANRFVYIDEDGSARALTPDERRYLNTRFYPTDGARPYIKSNYHQITRDGKISGFLRKKKLPRDVSLPI